MGAERFVDYVNQSNALSSALAPMRSAAFMAYPLVMCPTFGGTQAGWQQAIYQIAFEQAQAAVRSRTLFARDWLGVWN
jgi:hypothetical protein